MRKFTLTMFVLLLAVAGIKAQTSCSDLNGYVSSKNTSGTGAYTLTAGLEEKAAQTYFYSGPGKVTSVRVYGNYPETHGHVDLQVGISNVDASGRPTTSIQTVNATWEHSNNYAGYITVYFYGGGVPVDDNFAVTVALRNPSPLTSFQLQYTGNGEGHGENLASLAGTSTGYNWTSAMTSFNKDGDFYLVPRMANYIIPEFTMSTACATINAPVTFTNLSEFTKDSMFNTIGLSHYTGTSYFYNWDFGDGSPVSHVANPVHVYTTGSTHTVTLTCYIDGWNNDCSFSKSHAVSVGLSLTSTVTNAVCSGYTNGTITLTGTSGSAPYTYSLDDSPFQSSGVFNNLGAGTYTGMVRDNMGCESMTSITITEPAPIIIASIAASNASCGNADGALSVTASGGVGTLTYQLNSNPYQASGVFTNLAHGFYLVSVKDGNGCIATSTVAVNDQGAPTLSIISQTNVSCHAGNNGTIVMIGTGGSGTLQYSVNGGLNWQTNGSFLNLSAGIHHVIVKDATGCSYATEVTISEPPAITFAVSSTPVQCNGSADGTITVSSVTGGTGTRNYSLNAINYQSSNVFSGLLAGSYTVYVRDIASCQSTMTVSISQPSSITASAVVVNAVCNESFTGSITINATGGTPGYIYSIDGENFQSSNIFNELGAGSYVVTIRDENGCQRLVNATITEHSVISASITVGSSTCGNANGTILVAGSGGSGSGYTYSIDGTNFFVSGAFSGLLSGPYDVVIKDGSGCENVFFASIHDANGPTFTSVSHTNVGCYGGQDGTITINTVTGGSGVLNYSVNGSVWQTSTNFTDLAAGTYVLLVKDVNGCVGYIPVVITQPTAIVLTVSVVNVTCNGSATGAVTISAAGGAGTLAYGLDGETGFQSSNVFNHLGAGTYVAVVRDAAGCESYLPFTITEPSQIVIHATVLNVSCHGNTDGAINILATGGTGALTYSINGTVYQTSHYFENLAPGFYTCYVKDANGCVETLTVFIAEPLELMVISNVQNIVCAGGNNGVVDLTVLGGTYPYTYAWSNGEETEDIFNLVAGSYTVTITDANGCIYTQSFIISQPVNPLIVNGVVVNATTQAAVDGSVDITVTGGTGPFTFYWSNGATTEDLTNVAPGVYLVTITDLNGCVTTGVYVVSFGIGIEAQAANSESISLYPNPAHEFFTIDAGTFIIDKLEVMDILGQVVYTTEPKVAKPQVNTAVLSQGIYFVRLTIDGATITKRIEISK